jgi:hypothetical protein
VFDRTEFAIACHGAKSVTNRGEFKGGVTASLRSVNAGDQVHQTAKGCNIHDSPLRRNAAFAGSRARASLPTNRLLRKSTGG